MSSAALTCVSESLQRVVQALCCLLLLTELTVGICQVAETPGLVATVTQRACVHTHTKVRAASGEARAPGARCGLTVEACSQAVVADGRLELAHRVESSPQVVQHLRQQGGTLSRRAQSRLETLHGLLETSDPAVRHAHRQVQLTWGTAANELKMNKATSGSGTELLSYSESVGP